MTIDIRPAALFDAPALKKLITSGISIWGEGIETNLKPWVEVISTIDYIENNIKNPEYLIFMAEVNDAIVGTISLDLSHGTPHMCGLYCDTRGKGIGTALLKYSMDLTVSLGHPAMKCEIYEHNVPSITLMKKYGARHTKTNRVADIDYHEYTFDLTEREGIMVY